MDKRKGIILAIVLFLIIGLGTFVFAGGSDNNEKGQRNNTNETNKNNENGQNVETPEGEEGENEGEGGNNNNNNNNNSVAGGGQGQAQTPDVVNPSVPTNDNRATLLAALQSIQKMIDEATSKDAIGSARDARTDDLVTQVTNLNDEELNALLAKINRVLNDTESPVITPEDLDGSFNNKPVSITIKDDTKTTVKITMIDPNGDEVEVTEELTNLTLDGTYNLEVTDEAFNTTKLAFTIDSSNPTMNVANTHHFNSKENAIIEIKDFTLDRVLVTNQDTKETFTLYDEDNDGLIVVDLTENKDATYHIYTYDKAQNEQDYWVAVDTTDAEISFVETDDEDNVLTDLTNKDVTIKVFDKFLTDVTVTYPNGNTHVYKLENGDFDKVSGENRTFRLDVEEEGTYVVTAKDKVGNVTDAIEITIDKTIDMRHLYTLNSTYVNDSTWNGDNYYKVIGDGQTLTVELVFNEEIVGTPQIAIGTSQDYEDMVCYEPSWAKVKCNATITIDGENQGLVDGKEIPISIKSVQDKAGNTTTYTIDHIKTTSDYGKVVYDNTPIKYNAVTAYVNDGAEGEYIEEENAIKFYATYGDRIIAYITTAEKLAEMPVFTLTYGENEIVLTGDDVNIYDTNHETYKYRYQVVYTVPEDFEKIEAEAVLTVTNVVDGAGNDTINHDGKREELTVTNPYRVYIDTIAPEIELYRNNDTTNTNLVTKLDEYNRFNFYVGVKANDTYGISNITVNDEEYNNNSFGVSNDVKDYVVVAADKAGNKTEIQFTIDTKYPIVEINGTQYQKTINNIRVDEANIKIIEDNISSLIVTKDGQKLSDYDSTTTEFTLSEEGLYTIEVKDNNKNGNKTTVEFYVGKYDSSIKFTIPDNIIYDGEPVDEIKIEVVDSNDNVVEQPMIVNYYKDSYGEDNLLKSAPTDAGTYVIAAYYQNDTGDYDIAWNRATFTIKQATPTIELTEPSLVYDGNKKEYGIKVVGVNEVDITAESSMNVEYRDANGTVLIEAPSSAGKYVLGVYVRPSVNYTEAYKGINFEITREKIGSYTLNGNSYEFYSFNELLEIIPDNTEVSIKIEKDINEDIVIPENKIVSIDLNNNTLFGNKVITNNGTIKNISNGTIESTNNGIINNGNITLINNIVFDVFRTGINNKGNIDKIVNCNVEANYDPIYLSGNARINSLIENTVTGHYMDGIYVDDESTIGEIVSGTYVSDGINPDYGQVAGFGLYISTNATVESISGGTFKGSKAAVANYGTISCIIGGTFEEKYTGNKYVPSTTFLYDGSIESIFGGTFFSYGDQNEIIDRRIDFNLADGYEFVKIADNYYEVQIIR